MKLPGHCIQFNNLPGNKIIPVLFEYGYSVWRETVWGRMGDEREGGCMIPEGRARL